MSVTQGTIRIPLQQFAFLEVRSEVPSAAIAWAEQALIEGLVDVVRRLTAAAELAVGVQATVVQHVDTPPQPEAAPAWVPPAQAAPAWEPPAQGAPPAWAQQAPPAAPTPVAGGRVCTHGPRTRREGINKFGKPYTAWNCPHHDRTAQCATEWS